MNKKPTQQEIVSSRHQYPPMLTLENIVCIKNDDTGVIRL